MSAPSKAQQAHDLWQGTFSSPPIPVWLDCDTGHDDAFAILVSALTPRLSLLGISTTHGNAPLAATTLNTLSILTAISRPSIPVHPGSSHPICRSPCFAPDIHGSSGLDGTTCLPTPTCAARPEPAVQAAYTALKATSPGTAVVIATGTLTNIALLFLSYPDIAGHVKGVHIMGGAVGGFTSAPMGRVSGEEGQEGRIGNWTPWAEFNIYADPEAARAVFGLEGLRGKIMLAPLDLSHLFLADEGVQRGLLYGYDGGEGKEEVGGVRRLFHEILVFFASTYREVFGLVQGPPLHDVLPVLAVFAPEIFDDRGGERFEVDVVIDGAHGTEGIARTESRVGQTVVKKVEGEGLRIPRGVDQEVAWRIIDLCLGQAEELSKNA
ncbi:Uridine nucleosidase-like protein [Elsinoe fawcettii]|nr:Uridine nucleosidase-like protein [Elsinoe fawcettii]